MIQAIRNSPVSNTEAIQAATEGVVICDRSHWGRIEISDSDRLSFLHNQSTNQIKQLQAGQGCDTVIINSTARTLDLASVFCQEESLLLLVSPNRHEQLMQWFDRYIFFQDKVKLDNLTEKTGTISVIGPKSDALLAQLGWTLPEKQHHHTTIAHEGHPLTIAKGSGLVGDGFTLIFENAIADTLAEQLMGAGAIAIGDTAWEALRIADGRPQADAELTEDFNPLEAGLWHNISFDKGCYIGQETIARLDTYDGVKQKLWGINSAIAIQAGDIITVDQKKAGIVTSVNQSGLQGLGYVKTKLAGQGDTVSIGNAEATLTEVPFLTREKRE